ncbi:hypothetical protein B0H15DRAFT_796141 [Mycena belliarum]|uniref:DUF6532 domain-containing protein n=1 Tax=Mycena belliarum TaxID=1033014 RepID=A0AAD6UFD0_9AGAR|nr:hypothetical protein B0H15DRAFT_796141 [Mycena belliae]
MSAPSLSHLNFNINLPAPPLGRGRREVQLTDARKEHDERTKKNTLAGEKRTATRRLNATNMANASLGTPAKPAAIPGQPAATPVRLAATPAGPTTITTHYNVSATHCNVSATHRYLSTTTPIIKPRAPRMPLQEVNTNWNSPSYTDFSQRTMPPSFNFSPPPAASTSGTQSRPSHSSIQAPAPPAWFAAMPPSIQAALLASCNPSVAACFQSSGPVIGEHEASGYDGLSNLEQFTNEGKYYGSMGSGSSGRDNGGSGSSVNGGYHDGGGYSSGNASPDGSGNGGDGGVNGGDDGSIDGGDGEGYPEPSWARAPDTDLDLDGHLPAVSSLEFSTRAVEPAYNRKTKRRRSHHPAAPERAHEDDDSEEDDAVEAEMPRKSKKQKSRSISAIADDHREICEVAYDKLKIELTHRLPFPVKDIRRTGSHQTQTDEFTELILSVFTDAAFDLDLEDVRPTSDDIKLIRSRVPQFRAGVKSLARSLVPAEYKFVDIQTLKNPTQESIDAQLEANRARVKMLLMTYIYKDPDNIGPETMFCNAIFQQILTAYWFGPLDNDRAFYFRSMTQVELITLAFIIVAVLCAIEEWATGRWVAKQFSHKVYFDTYKDILKSLRKWQAHSEKQVAEHGARRNMTVDYQQELLRTARTLATNQSGDRAEEGEEGERDMFSLDAMFALVAPNVSFS